MELWLNNVRTTQLPHRGPEIREVMRSWHSKLQVKNAWGERDGQVFQWCTSDSVGEENWRTGHGRGTQNGE